MDKKLQKWAEARTPKHHFQLIDCLLAGETIKLLKINKQQNTNKQKNPTQNEKAFHISHTLTSPKSSHIQSTSVTALLWPTLEMNDRAHVLHRDEF